ncbi:Hypothetical predicted protein [Octopus vulgaris]|uniref:Uncharacterized protein n=1 Tax=Octopus vulgaris TaxID=6645 RepID=A0AA36F3T6_OCTVU|nr:Hypothetical predicted protein [Octopus vulgaris]
MNVAKSTVCEIVKGVEDTGVQEEDVEDDARQDLTKQREGSKENQEIPSETLDSAGVDAPSLTVRRRLLLPGRPARKLERKLLLIAVMKRSCWMEGKGGSCPHAGELNQALPRKRIP